MSDTTCQHGLYFAYGSNLSTEDFAGFCRENGFPSDCLRLVGTAALDDFELVFDRRSARRGGGVLNIARRAGRSVEGVLFAPTEEGWRALDLKEGHPRHYRRVQVVVGGLDGRETAAVAYQGERTADIVEPTGDYLELCRRGREAFGLDPACIDRAARLTRPGAVFVVGTFMRGQPSWRELAGLGIDCCLRARAYGVLRDHGSRPAFEPSGPFGDMVEGEYVVFRDVDRALQIIDAVEGFHGPGDPRNRCERITIQADVGGGRGRECFAYAAEGSDAPIIAGGDWRAHRGVPVEAQSRQIVEAHRRVRADLVARLSSVPDGPFGSILDPGQDVAHLVHELVEGRVCEFDLCRASLEWAVLNVPVTREGSPLTRLVTSSSPTRGPRPSSWTREVSRDSSGTAFTYILRYGDRDMWKIGWCVDVAARLADVNRHVPHEELEESWSCLFHVRRANHEAAYALEQSLLEELAAFRTIGERVRCAEHLVSAAWITLAAPAHRSRPAPAGLTLVSSTFATLAGG